MYLHVNFKRENTLKENYYMWNALNKGKLSFKIATSHYNIIQPSVIGDLFQNKAN